MKVKRKEALARQARYDKLSISDKLDILNSKHLQATKQRTKLLDQAVNKGIFNHASLMGLI